MLFKIAGLGILVSVVTSILKQNGREDLGTVAAVVGLVIGVLLMLSMVSSLLETVQQVFSLY